MNKTKTLILIILIIFILNGCQIVVQLSSATPGSFATDSLPKESSIVDNNLNLITDSPTPIPSDAGFTVHFIDVGQGDAALILYNSKTMLIDGGNSYSSGLIYAYLKKLNISHLDYIICTHPHDDHAGGLSGALSAASIGQAFANVSVYDSKAFNNFLKYLNKQGVEITIPKPGYKFNLGDATVEFLGPINFYDDMNENSLVLRIVYGETSFLFMGDAEWNEEHDIIAAGYILKSTVVKIGHHGSNSSSSYVFLREVMPDYAVISVGKGNDYNHPDEQTLKRLADAEISVLRTDLQGDIIFTSDGKTVSYSNEK